MQKIRTFFNNKKQLKIDKEWDRIHNIATSGRSDTYENSDNYAYEPTPVSVLEILCDSGYVNEDSYLIDYGCGRGRVSFYLYQQLGCRVTGIECGIELYKKALENLNSFGNTDNICFEMTDARDYKIPSQADCFYFFNPFSLGVFKEVVENIIDSVNEKPRPSLLFLYYPSDKYISYLMQLDDVMFVDELDCRNLYGNDDKRERILIFEII